MGASDNNRAKGCLDDGRSTERAMGYSFVLFSIFANKVLEPFVCLFVCLFARRGRRIDLIRSKKEDYFLESETSELGLCYFHVRCSEFVRDIIKGRKK